MPWFTGSSRPPTYHTNQSSESTSIRPCSFSSVSPPGSDHVPFEIVDTASIEERPNGPRYSELEPFHYCCSFDNQIVTVYYRLYAEDGPIPTAHPVYTNDPYLGRIPADFVAPPHTAQDIKLCLSGIEHIGDDINTSLFISTSQRTPIDDDRHVSISTHSGPGCVPHEPIALVAKYTGSGSRPLEGVTAAADRLSPTEGTTPFETQYRKCFEGAPQVPCQHNKLF